jgi:hypothetical protein
MATINSSMPLVPPTTPPLNVGAVAAAAPVALVAAEAGMVALPATLPAAQSPAPATPPAAPDATDGAAMRPDQLVMARQLAWPSLGGEALAANWRTMVRTYGAQLEMREQLARTGQLPAELLVAGQDPQLLRRQDLANTPPDAWRFIVHPDGPAGQRLNVITGEPDQPPGRRRRARAALRLDLELADGVRVTVQVEPLAEGLVVELCAPDAATLRDLRALQPELAIAIARSGLRVLHWRFSDQLPSGRVHAQLPSAEASAMLTLPVFRALAELALLLPARGGKPLLA